MNNFGWVGKEKAEEDFSQLADLFVEFKIVGAKDAKSKVMLFDVVRKLLGKDTLNYPQEIGDCVSFGLKNAMEYLMACERLLKGDKEKWRPIFPPYIYGISRVVVGKGQLGCNEDGSSGSWGAIGVTKYGILASDDVDVPKYSGSVAKSWGCKGPPSNFVHLAKQHLVKSAARIRSVSDLLLALSNGYPCTIASNQAFKMKPSANGIHEVDNSTQWPHQMCIVGADSNYKIPFGVVVNSWGDAHGRLKDFDTGVELPIGTLRPRLEIIEKMIKTGECYAVSNFDGFPDQSSEIDEALFKIV